MYSISSYCKDNIKCDGASNAPNCPLNNGASIVQILVVKLSNTSTMLFPPVAKTLSKLVEVFESLTKSFWTMDTPLFSGHLGTFDTLSHLMLSLQELMLYLKTYLQAAQKWLPIMTYIHPPIIVPSLGLHNAHWCIMRTSSWPWKSPEKN